jgi:IS66 C-terminal element
VHWLSDYGYFLLYRPSGAIGAKHVGIIQSLVVTCRLHGIDPYTYLADVLQRISEHPDSRVAAYQLCSKVNVWLAPPRRIVPL